MCMSRTWRERETALYKIENEYRKYQEQQRRRMLLQRLIDLELWEKKRESFTELQVTTPRKGGTYR